MAIGDLAAASGMAVVPSSGEEGKVKYGAREINRTRDYIAETRNSIPSDKPAARIAAGISMGTANPSGGAHGDIYFKII